MVQKAYQQHLAFSTPTRSNQVREMLRYVIIAEGFNASIYLSDGERIAGNFAVRLLGRG